MVELILEVRNLCKRLGYSEKRMQVIAMFLRDGSPETAKIIKRDLLRELAHKTPGEGDLEVSKYKFCNN